MPFVDFCFTDKCTSTKALLSGANLVTILVKENFLILIHGEIIASASFIFFLQVQTFLLCSKYSFSSSWQHASHSPLLKIEREKEWENHWRRAVPKQFIINDIIIIKTSEGAFSSCCFREEKKFSFLMLILLLMLKLLLCIGRAKAYAFIH